MQLQRLKQIHTTLLNPFILFGFQLSFSLLKTSFSPFFSWKNKKKIQKQKQKQKQKSWRVPGSIAFGFPARIVNQSNSKVSST